MPASPLRPRDLIVLANEYDAARDADESLSPKWERYSAFALNRQRVLAGGFTIYLVNVSNPYAHGSELLADLVQGNYKVPAPLACPVHPVWDGSQFGAARTWHDIEGHGFSGVGFTLDEEIKTFQRQATMLEAAGLADLICVVFSDTMQQLASTLVNHRFAPQKVVLTEYEKLIARCLG